MEGSRTCSLFTCVCCTDTFVAAAARGAVENALDADPAQVAAMESLAALADSAMASAAAEAGAAAEGAAAAEEPSAAAARGSDGRGAGDGEAGTALVAKPRRDAKRGRGVVARGQAARISAAARLIWKVAVLRQATGAGRLPPLLPLAVRLAPCMLRLAPGAAGGQGGALPPSEAQAADSDAPSGPTTAARAAEAEAPAAVPTPSETSAVAAAAAGDSSGGAADAPLSAVVAAANGESTSRDAQAAADAEALADANSLCLRAAYLSRGGKNDAADAGRMLTLLAAMLRAAGSAPVRESLTAACLPMS